jgi:hypothetical protein
MERKGNNLSENIQPGPGPAADTALKRDPEDRKVDENEKHKIREKTLDKTLADSFPTSDPPSSIPDPSEDAA